MKKYTASIIILLIFSIFAKATPVTPEKARKVALTYMNCSQVSLAADNYTLAGGVRTNSAESPTYYIFNNPAGGWVMISGEDSTIPILAVGDGGSFQTKDMPENIKYWMGRISSKIKEIRKSGSAAASAEIQARWANPRSAKKMDASGTVHLETPNWDQTYPYYNKCPKTSSGAQTITGCVATAMAEVLAYNKYPSEPVGTIIIPAYTTSSLGISVAAIDRTGYEYVWDDMPFNYSYTWTKEQKDAVATLMQHCGSMVKMNYNTSSSGGSSAADSSVPGALATYMGYTKSSILTHRENESPENWMKMLKSELDLGRPVIYSGQSLSGGGHEFVLDGYDSDGKVHINWGWGGYCNAWYAFNYLGPASGNVYSAWDNAIIGLAPTTGGSETPRLVISLQKPSSEKPGFSVTPTCLLGTFTVALDCIWNMSLSETVFNGKIKLSLTGRDNTIKSDLITVDLSSNPLKYTYYRGYTFSNLSIPKDKLEMGDYIALYYSCPDGRWIKASRYGYLTYENQIIDRLTPYDFSILYLPSDIKEGNIVYPHIQYRNEYVNTTTWKLDGVSLSDYNYSNVNFQATKGKHTLEVTINYKSGSSEVLRKSFTVQ